MKVVTCFACTMLAQRETPRNDEGHVSKVEDRRNPSLRVVCLMIVSASTGGIFLEGLAIDFFKFDYSAKIKSLLSVLFQDTLRQGLCTA